MEEEGSMWNMKEHERRRRSIEEHGKGIRISMKKCCGRNKTLEEEGEGIWSNVQEHGERRME